MSKKLCKTGKVKKSDKKELRFTCDKCGEKSPDESQLCKSVKK